MAEPSSTLSLKLVINKKANKVLFAEAGKEAVDFICGILTLPVGTVTKLLSEQGMVGCLSDLYRSIENLDDEYVQPNQHKDTIWKPIVYNSTEEAPLFLLNNVNIKKSVTKKLYMCTSTAHHYVTDKAGTSCTYCRTAMNGDVAFVEGTVGIKGGFVKGAVTYMVMDDLAVSPTSAIACLSFLNKLNVDVKSLEEKVVDLDMAKSLKLLKASFQTKNVLTEVFLKDQDNMEEDKKPCLIA